MMKRKIASILTLLAVLAGLTGCGPLGGGDKMTITAYLQDSAGLFVGNDVGVLGVPVGTIKEIEPAGEAVKVTMEIDGDQPVPADAGAVVVARSVATDRYVELTPVYKSGPKMADGAEIELAMTKSPVDFDNVLSALNTLATNVAGEGPSAEAVAKIIDSGAKTLSGKGSQINTSITSLADAVNAISNQRGNITGTLKSLDTLTTVLAQNQGTVRAFIDQVAQAAALLAAERQNFRVALNSFSSAVQLVAQFAKDNKARLTRSLDQSTDLMVELMKKRAAIREVLRKMPLAMQNLQLASNDGWLSVRLDPVALTALTPVIDQLCTTVGSVVPVCDLISAGTLTDPLGALTDLLGGTR